jgi:hypothetical protein
LGYFKVLSEIVYEEYIDYLIVNKNK